MPNLTTNYSKKPPRPNRICFSFAAYAAALMDRLKSSNIIVSDGLSDAEFSQLESKFNITFPPDLRAILHHGLPISPGFPNWRSSSDQQLQILLNLPTSSILRQVSKTGFWHPSWGPEPSDPTRATSSAWRILNQAPQLIPIYRHCYIPASPNVAGNPVFYVDHGGDLRLLSFDVAGFFEKAEFMSEWEGEQDEPVWAAKCARRIRFWSEMAEEVVEGELANKWWWRRFEGEIGGCMEGAVWKLRDGGWREEEIRDMMMVMDDGGDHGEEEEKKVNVRVKDMEGMTWQARVLSLVLLRAGWSREDVVDSLGLVGDKGMEVVVPILSTDTRKHHSQLTTHNNNALNNILST
ncbi:uncharacterized protein LOC130983129 [Arachis stenosperma]|uniref:uncharacterized protein LOC130983129 n=1 Tax=Arachis stenosperma TaxID=217475 RepID=UPI0025AB9200|nr:uncharacterized protein LOC130983129 [Arachis stenosperma]